MRCTVWMSDEGADVVRRLLDVDPSERLTLKGLSDHTWLDPDADRPPPPDAHGVLVAKRLGSFQERLTARQAEQLASIGMSAGQKHELERLQHQKEQLQEQLRAVSSRVRTKISVRSSPASSRRLTVAW